MLRDSITLTLPDVLDGLLVEPLDFQQVAAEIVKKYLKGNGDPTSLFMALVTARSALRRNLEYVQSGFTSPFPAEILTFEVGKEATEANEAVLKYLVDTLGISKLQEPLNLPSKNTAIEQSIVGANPDLNFNVPGADPYTLAVVRTTILSTKSLPLAYYGLEPNATVVSLSMLPTALTVPAPLPQAA